MRLNGKAAIMRHVGCVAPNNQRAWVMIRLRYGRVIYLKRASGKLPRYWALTEEIDAVDKEHSDSVYDIAYQDLLVAAATTPDKRTLAKLQRRERELVAV